MKDSHAASVVAARAFAVEAHGSQLYGTGPYVVHLDAVYGVLEEVGLAGGTLGMAAYLHDVVEDTKVTAMDVEASFGPEVARLVWAVTGCGATREDRCENAYAKIRKLGDAAANLKLADRIANVRASRHGSRHLELYRGERAGFQAALAGLGDPRLWALLDQAFARAAWGATS